MLWREAAAGISRTPRHALAIQLARFDWPGGFLRIGSVALGGLSLSHLLATQSLAAVNPLHRHKSPAGTVRGGLMLNFSPIFAQRKTAESGFEVSATPTRLDDLKSAATLSAAYGIAAAATVPALLPSLPAEARALPLPLPALLPKFIAANIALQRRLDGHRSVGQLALVRCIARSRVCASIWRPEFSAAAGLALADPAQWLHGDGIRLDVSPLGHRRGDYRPLRHRFRVARGQPTCLIRRPRRTRRANESWRAGLSLAGASGWFAAPTSIALDRSTASGDNAGPSWSPPCSHYPAPADW